MNKIKFLLLLLVTVTSLTMAQESAQISVSLPLAFPTKDFKEAVDNDLEGIGVGVASNVLFNPKGKKGYSPVFFGVDFSYVTFGRDKQPSTNDTPPYKTTFNYYTINGIARIFLANKTEGFTPFVDGMMGLKIYNTRTKIDKDLLDTVFDEDQPEVIHTTNDTGLGYGIGVGFYNRKAHDEGEGKGSFTLRVLYLWGDKVEYVKRGSLVVDNGFVNYETGFTNTNMFMVQLGFMIF